MGDIQMKSQPENKELYQLQNENSQLKDTIIELRDALEKQHIDNEERIQNVLASSNDEIVQLKATINVLRDERYLFPGYRSWNYPQDFTEDLSGFFSSLIYYGLCMVLMYHKVREIFSDYLRFGYVSTPVIRPQ